MADYWIEFSTGIVLNSDKEKEWWAEALNGKDLEEYEDEGAWDEFEEKWGVSPDSWPGFDHKFVDGELSCTLYVYSHDTGGRWKALTELMKLFLQKFNADGCLGLEWAYMCSKSHSDGFGGGAAFVTAENIEILGTAVWMDEKIQAFNKRKRERGEEERSINAGHALAALFGGESEWC